MPALSARHIASSALCAALLAGITGPAAMAADAARERGHAVSPDARLARADTLLAKVRKINGGELAPVADLLHAVIEADNDRLAAAEARKLGAAAKRALAKASAKDPADWTMTTVSAPATGVLPPAPSESAADLASDDLDDTLDDALDDALSDVLDDVGEAVDSLLEAITSRVSNVLPEVDDLLSEVEELIDALLDSGLVETASSEQTVSSTQTSTVVSDSSAVTLPVISPLTQVLLSLL